MSAQMEPSSSAVLNQRTISVDERSSVLEQLPPFRERRSVFGEAFEGVRPSQQAVRVSKNASDEYLELWRALLATWVHQDESTSAAHDERLEHALERARAHASSAGCSSDHTE